MIPMEAYKYTRSAPIDHSHITDFLNCIPRIDWQTCLPKFKDHERDDASLHLVKFHFHIHNLGVYLPKDYLMNMSMDSLEEDVRSWYERLQPGS